MKVFDRRSILRLISADARASHRLASRWSAAQGREPELAADVIRLGGILAQRPRVFDFSGVEDPAPVDPVRIHIAEGRRELAIELLALMGLGPEELFSLTREMTDDDR